MSGDLNLTDALVYSALYSRTTLSEKNGWIDADGRIYIFYSIENLSEDLRKGQTVIKAALRKLTAAGLIETKRNFGAPNTIYVKPYGLPFVCRNGKTMLFAGRFAPALILNPVNFDRVAEPHTRRAERGYKRRAA